MNTPNQILRTARIAAGTASLALAVLAIGCKNKDYNASAQGQDPALANMAATSNGTTAVLGQSQSATDTANGQAYPQDAAYDQGYNNGEASGDTVYEQTSAPPPLQRYDQPPAPGPGYIWTPGYWGSGPNGYVWVSGNWVRPPFQGALWTPPYWGYDSGRYRFHHGYWGRHIGYYGGIDYGYGYVGTGYYGGYWNGPTFMYNTAVTRIGPIGIAFTYNRPVIYNGYTYGFYPRTWVSYNGGPGGVVWAPHPYEMVAMREHHVAPFGIQLTSWHSAGGGYYQGFEPHHEVVVEHRGFVGAGPVVEHGHFDNGWHGRKNEGGPRGDWHDNGGGHGPTFVGGGEGHGNGHGGGEGHGNGHGGGHGHGR